MSSIRWTHGEGGRNQTGEQSSKQKGPKTTERSNLEDEYKYKRLLRKAKVRSTEENSE